MASQKLITIDIGSAWTKAFLVNVTAENQIDVEKSARLPTSRGDLSYALNILLTGLGENEPPKIFVSHLPEVEDIAKQQKGDFVKEEAAKQALIDFLKESTCEPVILDGGISKFRQDFSAVEAGKYLSFNANEIYLENFFGNRKVRVQILPKDTKDLEIEEAILRSSSLQATAGKNKKILIAGTGGIISGTPKLSRLGLLILDILEEAVVAQVFFDREFFLPSFGALLARYGQLAVATPGAWFESLGALVSLGGSATVTLDWGYSQVQQVELEGDEISLIPAPADQKIDLTFMKEPKEKKNFTVGGGSLGILLDSRPKPLPLAFGQETSRSKIVAWRQEIEKAEITKEAF